jgi:serine/threonine protein kinase
MGPKSEQDFSFLSDETAVEYASQLSNRSIPNSLKQKFEHSSEEMIEMLEGLLEFNHQFRLSAKECLKHKMFDDIRVERLEQGAPYQIQLQCDGLDQYDYV